MNPTIELQLLEKLNGFYSGAFSTLVMYTVGLIGLIGIAVPFVIQILQKRSNEEVKKYLEQHIDEQLKAKFTETNEILHNSLQNINNLIDDKISEHDCINKKDFSLITAKVLHLQANALLKDKKYILATRDYIRACSRYIDSTDDFGISRTLRIIYENCLKNLTKSDLENDKYELDTELNTLIEKIHAEFDGKYEDQLVLLKFKISDTKKREKKSSAEKTN